MDAVGVGAPSDGFQVALLWHGRWFPRLRFRGANYRKGRIVHDPRPRRFLGAGHDGHAVDPHCMGGGELRKDLAAKNAKDAKTIRHKAHNVEAR